MIPSFLAENRMKRGGQQWKSHQADLRKGWGATSEPAECGHITGLRTSPAAIL